MFAVLDHAVPLWLLYKITRMGLANDNPASIQRFHA
jgi:hypothetical protein